MTRRRVDTVALSFVAGTLGAIGCTVDLRVGFTPIDATPALVRDAGVVDRDGGAIAHDGGAIDAGAIDAGAIDAGTENVRTLDVRVTPAVMCTDGLAGREAEVGITIDDVGIFDGTVQFDRTLNAVRLSGAPITSAFETSTIVLRENVYPEQPAGTFVVAVPRDGPGPIGTRLAVAAMYIDTTLTPMRGEAGFDFEHTGGDGSCFVSFQFVLNNP